MSPGKDNYRPDHSSRLSNIMGLKPYTSNKAGTLFFGCYNRKEYVDIIKHKGPRVLYWGGSDILYMYKNKFKFPDNLKHVVGNRRNYLELKKHGITALIRPVCEADPNKFKISPMGNSVYVYLPRKRHSFYGSGILKQIASRLPHIKFILARYAPKPKPFPNAEVYPLLNLDGTINLYKKCFCSIRPTRHEGTSQSNIELFLMGRNVAHPHDSHWGVQCNTVDDYVRFIERESGHAIHTELRDKVLKEVNNFDFLD